ncbi:MAG: fatty acid desaturase [Betaproteobacteria bacterium]|nr:MAG: fatty acid desaturase [Betaproteobacteria bacterium]
MNINGLPELPSWIGGVLGLPWWGYIIVTLVFTHITIAAVTIYLHRHSAHRALDLHPLVSHFFRFWLWLTTGMVTKEWTAVHRKHHAKCETEEDPHSPQVLGLRKVLLEGSELYRAGALDQETLDKYGHGTPDDWMERNIYTKSDMAGVGLMLVINTVLFGPIGLTIWAIQMLWIPIFAAGIINGVGHYLGYRNFQVDDASTNIVPWGIIIGGEELHNNHHAYASSARLSSKWYEFDIGWLYIRLMEMAGLAKVKKLAPQVRVGTAARACDDQTLQAIITHRWDVLARFSRSVRNTCAEEIRRIAENNPVSALDFRRWLNQDERFISEQQRARVANLAEKSRILNTVVTMRQELIQLWQRSSATKEQLVKQLEDWCRRAELSGIAALQDFSRTLRSYAI